MAFSLFLLLALVATTGAQLQLRLFDLHASDLPADLLGITDGYVKAFCGPGVLGTTEVRRNNINPWWEEEFTYYNYQDGDVLRMEVFDEDMIYDDLLGVCQRLVNLGTHDHSCHLEKGGTLHYTYTLS